MLKKATKVKLPQGSKKDIMGFVVNVSSSLDNTFLRDLELPLDTLVINITRGGMDITLNGNFKFHVGDIIAVLCNKSTRDSTRETIDRMTSYASL